VLLKAGQSLRTADGLPVSPQGMSAEVELQEANGLLTFERATVAEIAAQLNRRNQTQIVVESPAVAAGVFGFVRVRLDSPESFARMVVAGGGAQMTVDKENDIIRLTE
jgi:ferric-dicitrate binding protein FerR (iron transport regulator)